MEAIAVKQKTHGDESLQTVPQISETELTVEKIKNRNSNKETLLDKTSGLKSEPEQEPLSPPEIQLSLKHATEEEVLQQQNAQKNCCNKCCELF